MSGRSCLTNLLESLECWTQALDDVYGLDIIYLHYRKAFDSVPHKRLIEKLTTYGITGSLRKWIESFLTSRKMKVGIRGTFSEEIEVISGVPQGSVLGTLLFLLFVNDLPRLIVNSMKMFADDTKLWLAVWCSGNALVSINAVALHRARLVLGWVTAFGQVNCLIT